MGVETAGMDGYRPLPAAKAVFVLHGFLFQAQESETGRLRRPADFGVRVRKHLKGVGKLLLGRVLSGKRKSAFPEKMERRGDRLKGEIPN